jgi:hypothetical protein
MTDKQREKVYELIAQGLTTPQIVSRMRGKVTPTQVAAYRAHWTLSNSPKVFEVQGTFIVEATSKEEALSVASARRVRGTRVLDSSLSASVLPSSQAEGYLS